MKKLFLSSSFSEVSSLLKDFVDHTLIGKSVTFIPTASIPESVKFYVDTGNSALEKLGLKVEVLELTKSSTSQIEKTLKRNDFIYISGGNTFFLLQELRRKKAERIIIDLIIKGKLYIGESAGSMILSPNIEYVKYMDNKEKAKNLYSYEALGVLDFYPLPHYTNFPFQKEVEKIISIYNEKIKLYPFKNSQAIIVDGDKITVKSVPLK